MRILWLYKYDPGYNFDHWLHLHYVEFLAQYPGVELVAWGPRIHEKHPNICPVEFDSQVSMEDLYNKFRFDIIILNTKSRMFEYYSPRSGVSHGFWLPKDFKRFHKTPKIMIEEDYHYETNDSWYYDMKINLILHRHFGNAQKKMKIKSMWFPFSVDINKFKPEPDGKRINKIGFVGSRTKDYPYRIIATRKLKQVGLLNIKSDGNILLESDYIKFLQKYVCHISGCSSFNITPAKMFEIMACGSALFTNEDSRYGLKELFPRDAYFTYHNDGSDVIQKARMILHDEAHTQVVAQKGLRYIKTRHTHAVRTKELLAILKREV